MAKATSKRDLPFATFRVRATGPGLMCGAIAIHTSAMCPATANDLTAIDLAKATGHVKELIVAKLIVREKVIGRVTVTNVEK